jgi:hypothetical protein
MSKIEWLLVILHIGVRSLERGERRVSFVEMTDFRLQVLSARSKSPSADSKNDLLLQPHLRVAAIEFTGYAPVSRGIGKIVGIEQVQLCSSNRHFPTAEPDVRARKLNLQP